jgi:hypothetical protein
MEKTTRSPEQLGKVIHRRLSSLKVIAKLLENELDLAKTDNGLLGRDLVENMLDTVELFIEDFEGGYGLAGARSERMAVVYAKPQVTRLN